MVSQVNDRLVADMTARLRDGGLRFGPRNLYYALNAMLERPDVRPGAGLIAVGVLLLVITVVVGILAASFFIWPLLPVGMAVTGFGLRARRQARDLPTTRALALGYDEFVTGVVDPRRGTALLEGMVETPPVAAAAAGTAVLVVCDRPETAAVLAANRAAAGLDVEVAAEEDCASAVAGRRVLSVHDADPRGCALPLRLREAGAAEVVDLGLRPGHIQGRRIPIIEGAPVLVAAEVSRLLTADEIVWLADGRRVEVAVLAPRELVAAVAAAVADGAPVREVPGVDGIRLSRVRLL
ncbi:MAG TPA: hypothetical protein VH134_04815 [Candidatus Dormibacteraeota bacterium]|jgi:hypothetical protein|nr:hypothetical protein [Candidatus Dormibacteraeota bacterium]